MAIKLEINMTNKWLYSLIAVGVVLALGVGVYAYQSNMRAGNPPVMGHSAGEINVENSAGEIISLQDALDEISVSKWESDWIAVKNKKVYVNGAVDEKGNLINLNHNLGTSSVMVQVLYAKDSGTFPSSPNLNTITYNTAHSDSNIDRRSVHGGTLVQGINPNSIDKLVTGHENVAIFADDPISWNGMRESNGWVKIILYG